MNGLARTANYGMLPLSEAFDRLFQTALTPVPGSDGGTGARIPANIWESGDGYQIALMVPGARAEGFEITALGNTLTVAGAVELSAPEGAKAVWQEFGPSQFRRQIGLPSEIDSKHIEAVYRDGVLLLTVPKAEHAKPRQIAVQTA